MIIDFHTHIYPKIPFSELLNSPRKKLRNIMKTQIKIEHWAQTQLRLLPEILQQPIEEFAAVALAPRLLIESSKEDHREAMDESLVGRAVVVAHPPLISNSFLLKACENESDLLPAVYLQPGEKIETLERFFEKGVRILKLHPPTDGLSAKSEHYREQIKFAADQGMIVLIHSGVIHSRLMFKNPKLGDIARYESLFEDFPKVDFVVLHLNFNEPRTLIDLAKKHENLYVTTSWQPSSVIGEAVHAVGEDRVLYSSDWPILGNNMSVSVDRVRDGRRKSFYGPEVEQKILGENAKTLLEKYDL